MIDIQLTELDLSLEVAEITDLAVVLDEHSTVGLQGPLVFGVDAQPIEFGYLDLDLIGFPYHGLSAYEVAVKNGFVGSELEWLASLKGEPGDLSPAGQDGVSRAEAAAASASGDAFAAAGFRSDAYAYSGVAGEHARSSAEMYSQARVMRDETGQIANAATSIFQESEALIFGATELARATIQERVLAETARSGAEIARDRTAISETNAEGSSASAFDNATMAVEARNVADDRANAAILAESGAQTAVTEARAEASAARQSQLQATAARDEGRITAAAVIVDRDRVSGYVDDARAEAEASRDERIAAEAARGDSEDFAEASLTHSQTAKARSDDSERFAEASDQKRLLAETAQSRAEAAEGRTVTARDTAEGYKAEAKGFRDTTLTYRDQAGQSADAALRTEERVVILADAAGDVQSALAGRVDAITVRVGTAEGNITTYGDIAITARDKANAVEGTANTALYRVNLTTGVSLNANGFVTGWRASNDGVTGIFTILGNVFRLVDPNGGTPITPFEVIGSMVYFNANVRINGNLLVTGTINTPALAEAAVTGNVAAYNDLTVQLSHNVPMRVHGLYIDVKSAQSPIKIDFNCWATFSHDAGGSFIAYVQLVRSRGDTGGQVLSSVPIYGSGMANDTWQGPVPIKYLDRPGETGNWHYYIQIFTNVSNMSKQSVTARYGELTELKNNPSTSITTGTGSGTGVGAGGGSSGGGGTGGGGGEITDPNPPIGGGGGTEMPVIT